MKKKISWIVLGVLCLLSGVLLCAVVPAIQTSVVYVAPIVAKALIFLVFVIFTYEVCYRIVILITLRLMGMDPYKLDEQLPFYFVVVAVGFISSVLVICIASLISPLAISMSWWQEGDVNKDILLVIIAYILLEMLYVLFRTLFAELTNRQK